LLRAFGAAPSRRNHELLGGRIWLQEMLGEFAPDLSSYG
jgi:hypothetical protein